MKKLMSVLVLTLAGLSGLYASGKARYRPMGLGFNVPTIDGKGYVTDPKLGELIYDSSDNIFYGRSYNPAGAGSYFWAPMSGFTGSGNPTGTVITFAGANCPTGYLAADGKSYSQSGAQAALYGAIASNNGDGSTGTSGDVGCPAASGCFNVPDYRGRFLRGVNGSTGNDPDAATRTAMATGGATGDNVGSLQGQATKKNGLALSDPGHAHQVYPTSYGAILNSSGTRYLGDNNGGPAYGAVNSSTASTNVSLGTGDNETRPVNAYVNYCIKN